MKSFLKKQKGFTIIELMITVGILGVLSSIAMTAYKDYTTQAKWGKVIHNTRALKLAVETCLVDKAGTFTECDSLDDEKIAAEGISAYATGDVNDDFQIIQLEENTAAIEIVGRAPLAYCKLLIKPTLPPGTGMIIWEYYMKSGNAIASADKCVTFVKGAKAIAIQE
jgi:type IV pilus assembly protein PilA